MKRSPLRRKTKLLPKRRQPTPTAGWIERDLWRENLGPCVRRGTAESPCEGKVRGHHVIESRTLKREGLRLALWDRRNRMALCDRHHARFHSGVERVPMRLVSSENRAFATDHGLAYLIGRFYPEEQDA